MKLHRFLSLAGAPLFLSLVLLVTAANAAASQATVAKAAAPRTSLAPETFPSAEAAAQALLTANEQNDVAALNKILGSDSAEIVSSGDGVQDSRRRERFVTRAKEGFKVIPDPADIRHYLIAVGRDEWPLPIPIVKTDSGGYRFDPAEAKVEILARRVGRNELTTLDTLRTIVDAEREYAYSDVNQSSMRDYAQKFVSTPGKHDGLYWEAKPGESESPLGAFYQQQFEEGYELFHQGKPSPFHGYIFRILTAQGADAVGGARNYIVRGDMIGGFAVVAYPTDYGVSGVKTFIVDYDGVVFEKDLGPNTKAIATAMTTFNPDRTWIRSPEEETSAQ
jgi:Protein of unknown function (DUF2950)